MTEFKNSGYLKPSNDSAFDSLYWPGQITYFAGIYRCEACGRQIVCEAWKPMPPASHHDHRYLNSPIKWRLIVRATSCSGN